MSAEIQGMSVRGKATSVMKSPGQIGIIREGSHTGKILLRHYSGYVSLNTPKDTWDDACSLVVETLPAGTKVLYTSEA